MRKIAIPFVVLAGMACTSAYAQQWYFVGVFAEYQKHDKLDIDGYFAGVDLRF